MMKDLSLWRRPRRMLGPVSKHWKPSWPSYLIWSRPVGAEDRESVRVALENLDGGVIFNEAVASQYMQAKQQQLAGKLEVLQLQNAECRGMGDGGGVAQRIQF